MSLLTDAELRTAGGWQALQEARRMVDAGGVTALNAAGAGDGKLVGTVLVQGAARQVVLRWSSPRDVAVSCGCTAARRGLVCAHGLALGVAANRRDGSALSPVGREDPGAKAVVVRSGHDHQPVAATRAVVDDPRLVQVRVPTDLRRSWQAGALPVLFQMNGPTGDEPGVLRVDALLPWLQAKFGGMATMPPALRLDGALVGEFLGLLGRAGVVLAAADGEWEVQADAWRPVLELGEGRREDEPAVRVRAIAGMPRGVAGPTGWLLFPATDGRGVLCPAPDWSGLPSVRSGELAGLISQGGELQLPLAEFLRLYDALGAVADLDGVHPGFVIESPAPVFFLSCEGTLDRLGARLDVCYGGGLRLPLPLAPDAITRFPLAATGDPRRFYDRNAAAELAALEQLERAGFQRVKTQLNEYEIKGENNVLTFYASLPRWLPDGWRVEWGRRWHQVAEGVERTSFAYLPRAADAGWLEGEVECQSESGLRVTRADVQRLLRGGRGHFRAHNGKRIVVDLGQAEELEEMWRDIGADQVGAQGLFRYPAEQDNYVRAMTGGLPRELPVPELDDVEVGPVLGKLRGYQRHGVAWLAARAEQGWGGLLADDMGLGKTLQALVFLEWQRRRRGADAGPAVVVCPTSLLGAWCDEVQRFLPHWQVLVQHGSGRKDYWDVVDAADLVLTTYALLPRDLEHFRRRRFRAVVLDEASLVRNPDSQGAKAVHALQADARVALTGTPVENSVRDLWSVMQFVQPGYLGRREEFRLRFENPVAGGNHAVCARLQKRLQPLLLRRLKAEVAPELPERIEQISWCELDGAQAALYNAILKESRERLGRAIQRDGFAKCRMGVLTALLRLRQVCCDPGLVGVDAEAAGDGGAKRALFRERLREALEGGHRVLVFSQFVAMLERLREEVAALGAESAWLTGASTDRAEQVRSFQAGAQPVFLLSLKAGGYGLTLTAADTVILYDPWWNPAVEAQAIDRAHRIGQAKVVTAYRLIARGTVEEKIHQLQQRKRDVARRTLNEAASLDGLDENDLRALLEI